MQMSQMSHGRSLFYYPPTSDVRQPLRKIEPMDSQKKALVSLLIEIMISDINKAVRELIILPTNHISHHTSQHIR